jgi:hypothetical protein
MGFEWLALYRLARPIHGSSAETFVSASTTSAGLLARTSREMTGCDSAEKCIHFLCKTKPLGNAPDVSEKGLIHCHGICGESVSDVS